MVVEGGTVGQWQSTTEGGNTGNTLFGGTGAEHCHQDTSEHVNLE